MIPEPLAYCLLLGALVAGLMLALSAPLLRIRKPSQVTSQLGIGEPPNRNRVSQAMRQWAAVRADADLEYVVPNRAPVVEPEATVPAQSAAVEPSVPLPEPEPPPLEEASEVAEASPFLTLHQNVPDFYELLQVSPRADLDTIRRVYRIMAARFHPDNPVSGDHERFIELQEAYEVLSRPERRAQYDGALQAQQARPLPVFENRIFVDGLDGEVNRRFGVLALLYQRRRSNQSSSGVPMLTLEQRMSLPREHLEFTLWYLRARGYVQVLEDNSDFAITAAGVDFVETNSSCNSILQEVLAPAASSPQPAAPHRSPASVVKRKGRRTRPDSRKKRTDGPHIIVAA
jgi:hypothetical protein